ALYSSTYSVGGVNDQGEKVSYASYGPKLDFVGPTLDFFIPGLPDGNDRSSIVTTDIEGIQGYSSPDPTNLDDPDGNYIDSSLGDFPTETFGGTSASCPIITGVAALVLAHDYSFTSKQLFERLAYTADKPPRPVEYSPDEFPTQAGTGIPNAFRGLDGFNPRFGYGRPNPYNALT
ncbi:S8 family serine peptidase, partial [Candidatus Poribacteria bacterium]|nr:S8 family serine peptidase [Candidatus Poribacteria bacterium]